MLDAAQLIARLVHVMPTACLVSSCGYPTRTVYAVAERPANFYLVGSMGMAGPIAYGIALAQSNHRVIAIDGDGSVVMNLGGLVLAGVIPVPLVHVVLDNGVHESTGGQRTLLPADLPAIALAAGYARAISLKTYDDLDLLDELRHDREPVLVHALIERSRAIGGRVRETPPELVHRLKSYLNEHQEHE